MTSNPLSSAAARAQVLSVDRRAVRVGLAVLAAEATLLVAYFALTEAVPTGEVRYLVYPFIWINTGLWAVARVEPVPANRRHRLLAGTPAAAYFLVVAYLPGTVGFGMPGTPVDLRVTMYAPGWGPLIAFASPWLRLYLVPFEVIGYTVLAYLVYANLLDATRGALSGLLGLSTCVGCTVPLVTPVVGLLGGPTTSLATTAYAWSYDVGTLLFVLTVGLLHWGRRNTRS